MRDAGERPLHVPAEPCGRVNQVCKLACNRNSARGWSRGHSPRKRARHTGRKARATGRWPRTVCARHTQVPAGDHHLHRDPLARASVKFWPGERAVNYRKPRTAQGPKSWGVMGVRGTIVLERDALANALPECRSCSGRRLSEQRCAWCDCGLPAGLFTDVQQAALSTHY